MRLPPRLSNAPYCLPNTYRRVHAQSLPVRGQMRSSRQLWLPAGAAAAAVLLTLCHGAASPMPAAQPPSMPTFGSGSAYVDPNKPLQNLTVAAIESGAATATGTPLAVQQAFLKNVQGNATTPGRQTVNADDVWRLFGSEMLPQISRFIPCLHRSVTENGPGHQTACHPAISQ